MDSVFFFEALKELTWQDFFSDILNKEVYIECMRTLPVLCTLIFFWIGCNIGSFLNVCIYRLPLGMSLLHPKSHCPKCGHKLGVMENIPIFSYLCLKAACKQCKQRISPRYIIVETLTGLIFAGIYLKIYFCYYPVTSLVLMFIVASMAITAAFTDCDVRIIPDTVTIPCMIVIPVFWLLHNLPSLHTFDVTGMVLCLCRMAIAAGFFSLFTVFGKKIFKRDAFGWGDVKMITVFAAAFPLVITFLIVLVASIMALVYMPVYWHFHPRRKNRGFAFAPFLAVAAIGLCIFEPVILPVFHSIIISFITVMPV